MSQRRSSCLFACIAATLQLAIPSALQGHVTARDRHDHGLFECAGDGLSRKESTGFGFATVGPLPLTSAKSYAVVAYFVVMPVGAYTPVHTHPGPEAWYVLDGAQCLDTPGGALRVAAGQTGVAPPDTPMQLHNSGSINRRALFIVIHDAVQRWNSPSDWKASGACDH